MSKVDTKQRILEAASKLFYYNGVNATGINEILKESGAARGSFYHFFPNGKDQMAYETVQLTCENQIERTRSLIHAKKDPVAAFQHRIQALIDEITALKGQDELSIGLVALESWKNSPALSKLCGDTLSRMIDIYTEKLMAHGMSEKTARGVGTVYQTMIDGALILSVSRKEVSALKEVQKQIKVLVNNAE